jgi:hypothetical protein
MNHEDLKKAFVNEIVQGVNHNINFSSIISKLYDQFTEKDRKAKEALETTNKLLVRTFESIAASYGLEYNSTYDLKEMEKRTNELKEKIASLAGTQKPKQRYFCYAYSDDCGHTHCSVVSEKDIEHVNSLVSENDMESICNNSILLQAMSSVLRDSVQSLIDLPEDDLHEMLIEFFEILIKDEKVSLIQFSEYLESAMCAHRHSGKAKSWLII